MRSLNSHGSIVPPARFRRRTSCSLDIAAYIPFYSCSSRSPKSKSKPLNVVKRSGLQLPDRVVHTRAFDGDSFFVSPTDDWVDSDCLPFEYVLSSSDGDDDSDGEFLLSPLTDMDLPPTAKLSTNDAVTVTAHRLGLIGKGHKRHRLVIRVRLILYVEPPEIPFCGFIGTSLLCRINYGIWNNCGLMTFLTGLLLFVDWCAWKIVRLPLPPFHLSRPFFLSAALVASAGYVCVPLLDVLMVHDTVRRIGYFMYSRKRPTPTMGGLFMVPIGVGVALFFTGFTSVEVSAAALAAVVFALIGLIDDIVRISKKHHRGLSMWTKCLLELALGIGFAVWLDTANMASPYSMKMLVPLPAPMGLVCLGKLYLLLTSMCFVSMGRGIDLTDGLDGLAAGTAALSFIGMTVAVLPICSELGIFGASMAGACVGFLLHNRYKASVLLGDTGSLALGGALAAMAACTGMFFPLFISSGIIVLEALSVLMQVVNLKARKSMKPGFRRYLTCIAPLHRHLQLWGVKEPMIVGGAYVISSFLALSGGYVALISA
ncbi:Phospho-N-acetylmuramoyl-pentapeptide-transferasehomolog [Linum perenne]